MLLVHQRAGGAVDECASGSASLGLTQIGQRTAAGNWDRGEAHNIIWLGRFEGSIPNFSLHMELV